MYDLEPIQAVLEDDEATVIAKQSPPTGSIGKLVMSCKATANNLLGFVLAMSYDEATIVTCDAWKRKCGGVPKNSFVIIRLNPLVAKMSSEETPRPALILARIIEPVATPLTVEQQQTIFTIHKVQAIVDPYTNAELQWGALKAAILGTYYDDDDNQIIFGNDIDSYMSPHFYEVYVPNAEDLEMLINSFVSKMNPIAIGELRYTETQTTRSPLKVSIKVSPQDFIANRTALFGKTRMGKSNTIKVISDMILHSGENVGQIIFDLNGEYSNINEWDDTSLFALHQDQCVRYTLNPRPKKIEGVADPTRLQANFYKQVELGHSTIVSLFPVEHRRPAPNYLLPLLDWEPCNEERLEEAFSDLGDRRRYLRAQSLYFAALANADFTYERNMTVPLCLSKAIRVRLGQMKSIQQISPQRARGWSAIEPEISDVQPLQKAIRIYEQLYKLWDAEQKMDTRGGKGGQGRDRRGPRSESEKNEKELKPQQDEEELFNGLWPDDESEGVDDQERPIEDEENENEEETVEEIQAGKLLFPASKDSGKPYFEPIHVCLLRMLGDKGNISGTQYLRPFSKYHHTAGGNIIRDIVEYVNAGKTVIIDLANADEVIFRYYSELISREIFSSQTEKFTAGTLGKHSVLFYFEEAHNLFRKDDKDLRSIYNKLAKEGAKNKIGMVYATQSMTTLSPDLLKNTENFFIAHLNDDREIHELTNRYEFKDIGLDVQRCKTKGYVRMITLSHRYALPVQIRKFGPALEA
jgi:hypothetical protein